MPPQVGRPVVLHGGAISVTVLSGPGDADYHDILGLYLVDPLTEKVSDLGENHVTLATVIFNPDGLMHAILDSDFGPSIYIVGFADIYGEKDSDMD